MKCSKCENEFNGNFCPKCGKSVNAENIEKEDKINLSEAGKDIVKGGFVMYLHTRLKYLFLGAFISAFCGFAMGKIITGIALTIAGILLMPPVLKRCNKKQRICIIVIAILCLFIGIFTGLKSDHSEDIIDYVKQYQIPNMSYSISGLLDLVTSDVVWDYYKDGDAEYVTSEFEDYPGKIKLIFKVEDYPELYDALLNGESNQELYDGYNLRLFGREDENIGEIKTTESPDISDTLENIDEDDSALMESERWFITYNNFYRIRDIGSIEINVMNDKEMFVQCTGSDGSVAEWEMDLNPAEVGDDGEYIYYYGKGIKMSYYPSDNHIHVDAEDNYFGDYYPND